MFAIPILVKVILAVALLLFAVYLRFRYRWYQIIRNDINLFLYWYCINHDVSIPNFLQLSETKSPIWALIYFWQFDPQFFCLNPTGADIFWRILTGEIDIAEETIRAHKEPNIDKN